MPAESKEWELLNKHFTLVDDFNDDQLIDSYKNFHQYVALGNAFISKGFVNQGAFKRFMTSSAYATYYLFAKQGRLNQNEYYCANPDLVMAREIWNLMDNKFISSCMAAILPSIKIS